MGLSEINLAWRRHLIDTHVNNAEHQSLSFEP